MVLKFNKHIETWQEAGLMAAIVSLQCDNSEVVSKVAQRKECHFEQSEESQ